MSEAVGHIGEIYPYRLLFLAKIGYYIIFALDPANYLFAILYINCWLDDSLQTSGRKIITGAYQAFVAINFILVTVSTVFDLKWFYYFEGNQYMRGPLFMIRGALLLVFCLLLSFYTLCYRKKIYSGYRTAIFALPTLAMAGALLQIIFTGMNMTYASIAIGLLILFFYLQAKNLDVDYLTGALNRRGLDIRLEEAVKNANSSGKPFSAIMLDLDRFKAINDTYGHTEGDYALKTVANVLFKVFPTRAHIGRFGGDEFCVVSEISDPDELDKKIEIVDDELDKLNYKRERPYDLEVSMGHMVYDVESKMTAKEFQMAIDELMYIQKRKHHLSDKRRNRREG
jgi:diguanylate cyclase (GGDEF)-like protein